MTIRERTEELEYETLSPFAAKSREAKRKVPMEECDFRTKFQRDRDRILHSKCFRRLKHKTQVYITAGDHYRTRMTHSLEVSQISRTIARGLRLNEDLTEADGTAYCEATLVNEENGKDIITTNYVRYSDKYIKVDGKWYIKRRRTTFLISEKRSLNA